MATQFDNADSGNLFTELVASLKPNKQVLRKILEADEISAKKVKIDSDQNQDGESDEQEEVHVGENLEELDIDVDKESVNDSLSEMEDSDEDIEIYQADDIEGANKCSDPFRIHFEQILEEEAITEIENCIFEKKENGNITQGNEFLYYTFSNSVMSRLEKFNMNLHKSGKDLFEEASIKQNLVESWKALEKIKKSWLNKEQNDLFRIIASYKDLFNFNSSFDQWESNRHLYVLHIVNHILKSRARVLKNNAKIAQAEKDKKEVDECRDQGLTRPKVLILVPFRNSCLLIVNDIIKLLSSSSSKMQIMQKKRFMQEYSPDPNEKESKLERPDDFKAMFKGNIDDCFRIGLSISKNTVKLYSEFYSADVIIASPLGLRTIIGAEGEKQDFDFLSSVEILIMDQADAFLMQNWEHTLHIFNHIHLTPKHSHGADFSRVRMWNVNGWAKFYRQTIMFSSIQSPELNNIFNRFCFNYSGKTKYISSDVSGSVEQIVSQVPQVYQRVTCNSYIEIPDERFSYFTTKVLPDFKSNLFNGTAIFVPSYFDFVRVRNYFKKENLSFVQISEYSKRSNISRSRSMFLERKKHFLLLTERFYFFYRYRIRGIRHVIFYELPCYPVFYPEIINYMDAGSSKNFPSSASCTVIYSRFDGYKLDAIVGGARCRQMIASSKDTHMVITGN